VFVTVSASSKGNLYYTNFFEFAEWLDRVSGSFIWLVTALLSKLMAIVSDRWWRYLQFWRVFDHEGTPRLKSHFSIVDTFDDVQKLASFNLVLRTTIMTPVKRQTSKLQTEKSHQMHGFQLSEAHGNGSTHERC
jgi:hypothetical protein